MKKIDNFNKALHNLQEGLKIDEPYTIVEQTGIIGLFAICFEQSWKMMKWVLEENGRYEQKTGSPKAIIKTAYQCGMIEDETGWLELLQSRNILAHTYSDEEFLDVIRKLKIEHIRLFEALKREIKERWL